MKTDIIVPTVTQVAVAAVPRTDDLMEELWDIYVINLRAGSMTNLLITSQGYGAVDGNDMSTTVLRHFHQELAANAAVKIEPIQTSLFGIKNEYWVSFNDGEVMMDKRFIFEPGQISAAALETVPVLGKRGVVVQ
ncbi:hypothetical protein [Neolewinella antarctica]|uniref:Uncharacterized protein n=1 Tax=Neolewinella antarctica TaxID=442734 RepID=A0ABX0XBM3_9BACT|nr:hypothetical protein [Neolewinella antarctica]NJC26344.1 hypothetical protein [Neolewinella antarctica]